MHILSIFPFCSFKNDQTDSQIKSYMVDLSCFAWSYLKRTDHLVSIHAYNWYLLLYLVMKHIPHNPPPSSPPHLTFENSKLNLPLHIQTSHSFPINSTSLQTTKPHIHSLKTQPSSPPPNLTFIPSKLNLPPHHQTSHSFPQNSISLSTSKPHIHSLKLNFPPHHQILSNSLPITNPYIHPVITQTPPPPPSNLILTQRTPYRPTLHVTLHNTKHHIYP